MKSDYFLLHKFSKTSKYKKVIVFQKENMVNKYIYINY